MNSIKIIGKYLDQPKLVAKFSNAVPAVMVSGGLLCSVNHVRKAPEDKKEKEFIKTLCVLTGTIASALLATRGLGKHSLSPKVDIKKVTLEQKELITEFLKNNKVGKEVSEILEKAKDKILNPKQIGKVFSELESNNHDEFLSKFVPEPELKTSKDIFEEIGRLSMLGLVPVLGGVIGGMAGNKLTEERWKDKIPNIVKEASYQYLANIFLCNVGAGGALAIMEKANIHSKGQKALGMLAGIVLTGIVGGSAIANFIGKKYIDPIFKQKCDKHNLKHSCSKRTPEPLDVSLHIDDVATIGVMSGLRWIEPALPILYSISGFRAGMGYRNDHRK